LHEEVRGDAFPIKFLGTATIPTPGPEANIIIPSLKAKIKRYGEITGKVLNFFISD
jgi:hypothetical protein